MGPQPAAQKFFLFSFGTSTTFTKFSDNTWVKEVKYFMSDSSDDSVSEKSVALNLLPTFSPESASQLTQSSLQSIRAAHNVRMGEKGKIIRMPKKKANDLSDQFYARQFSMKVGDAEPEILSEWHSIVSRKLETEGDMFLRRVLIYVVYLYCVSRGTYLGNLYRYTISIA